MQARCLTEANERLDTLQSEVVTEESAEEIRRIQQLIVGGMD